jgi:hypothetical protein
MKSHLNLLPISFRRRKLLRSCLLRWSVLWAVTCAVTVGACLLQYQRLCAAKRYAAALAQQSRPLRQMKSESERMEKELQELHGGESLVTALETPRSAFQLIGVISRSTRLGENNVWVNRLELSTFRRRVPTKTPSSPPKRASGSREENVEEERKLLRIQGNAVNDLAVARLVGELRDAAVFETVELKSTTAAEVLGQSLRQYEISCTY